MRRKIISSQQSQAPEQYVPKKACNPSLLEEIMHKHHEEIETCQRPRGQEAWLYIRRHMVENGGKS